MPKHENLAAALAAFQAELPKLTKDQNAKVQGETQDGRKINYSYGYADLSQVTEGVSPALGKHGLSFTSFPTVNENGAFVLAYSLLHEGGEMRDGLWPLPDPNRTKPQQLGSAITYARRYAFMAVTNTFPGGEDDDGAAAAPIQQQGYDNRQDRQRPQNAPTSPAAPAGPPREWTDEEVTEQHGKLDSLDLDKAGQLYDWMATKGLHDRPLDFGGGYPPVTATTRLAVRLATIAQDESTDTGNLSWIREFADGRGLLKTPVSPNSLLGEVLTIEKDKRTRAVVDESSNAQTMRQAATDSWPEETQPADGDGTPGSAGAPGQ
jgi:hypothetical protein